MGGSSYDRDVYSGSSYSSWGVSDASSSKLSSSSLHSSMNPTNRGIKSNSKNPIVIVLDVTGSNINFARLVYDKMPMFYGQIEEKGYLNDFDIALCAIGDLRMNDSYPLQVSDFAKGIEIDSWLEKLVLEGGGGGNMHESYELAAHYLAQKMSFAEDARPIVFFIGDEAPYKMVSGLDAMAYGIPYHGETNGFADLRQKTKDNVFVFLNPYSGNCFRDYITDAWNKTLAPEHVIKIKEEKAIVDLMLGVLALLSKKSLKTYALDMGNRGQTVKRIAGVTESLNSLSTSLVVADTNVHIDQINTNLPVDPGKAKVYGGHTGRRL